MNLGDANGDSGWNSLDSLWSLASPVFDGQQPQGGCQARSQVDSAMATQLPLGALSSGRAASSSATHSLLYYYSYKSNIIYYLLLLKPGAAALMISARPSREPAVTPLEHC